MCRMVEQRPAAFLLPTAFRGVQMQLQISTELRIRAAAKSATLPLNQSLTVFQLHGISFAMPARALLARLRW